MAAQTVENSSRSDKIESEIKKFQTFYYISVATIYDWLEERLKIQAIEDDITNKYVPPHVNIFYCLGGITLTYFLVQIATGFAMTFYYRPTVTEAFASVQYIVMEAKVGVVLGVLTTSFGVTGYSLPRDQIGYWAAKIVTCVLEAIPIYVCHIGIHNQMCLCSNRHAP
ncbi:uncharacterized protein LOC111409416 [Olea europaea var. sylvestris]|uniref:uncharacterized protein LOC111409416 n=1 Tax=Olea europaea var. sylvestris TaxID=158386 RepID=UPI000C1D0D18|nr:uncharacterized protein LOC111409416 [Olea europaea var. sylvestris]